MKPAPFAYRSPETLEEALDLLALGDDARVLAGGQSLVPLMKFRIEKPAVVIDVNRVPGLDQIETADGELRIGALTRQQTLLESDVASATQPLLRAAGQHAGYLATRHRGTVGGSLAYAAPWAELTAASVALDARIHVRSKRGERTVAAREFFVGAHTTVLEPDELLTGVAIPAMAPRTGVGFHEVTTCHGGYLHVAAAATVTLDGAGACLDAELVLLRVAPTPHRVDVAPALRGAPLNGAALDAIDGLIVELEPADEIEVSGTYLRRVAGTLARRALQAAYDDAREVA